MTKEEFQKLVEHGVVMLDGATGTNLQQAGMPIGVCPEQWILENRDVMLDLQRRFVEAGTQILYAPTFTGNRIKLAEYGLEERLKEINGELVRLCKEAAGGRAYVAGDMTMTGRQLYPMGDLSFDELVQIYKEQAQALYEAGADLFIVETMMSLQETRACVLAIKDVCDLPVMASLTFEKDGRTLYGTPPEAAVVVLQGLGVDAVGLNCSTGPEDMVDTVRSMYAYADIPVLAKPNAGLPILEDGRTIYKTTPEEFGRDGRLLVEAGARIVGGCCGTTPAHIRALADSVRDMVPLPIRAAMRRVLASERSVVEVRLDGPFRVVGERINPTGKKKLQAELREGKLDLVRAMAREQEKNGAAILDVNMGTNGIDEKEMMLRSVYEVTAVSGLPLCIDSSFPEVIEAALRIYPGRALINSISFEKEKMKRLLPVAKKYGAMFILLPVSDQGIPQTLEEKHDVIRNLLQEAAVFGFTKEDVIVDGLVATVGASPSAALDCMATFSYCRHELRVPTVCGLSNISFGLPDRTYVNMAFLSMAIANGLTLAIANPSQDMLMNAAAASNMLMNKAGSDIAYIKRMQYFDNKEIETQRQRQAEWMAAGGFTGPIADSAAQPAEAKDALGDNAVYRAVLEGEKDRIVQCAQGELQRGLAPEKIIDTLLIPAINKVGEFYDQQVYFLPQLIASANTMETAIAYLEPLIQHGGDEREMATIVIATVEGDVHDIGKNLVALMLRNYGYHVIDLGKDVPAASIIETAMREKASIVGLSALMTTTMMRMKEVIALASEKQYTGRIIIGGAAVTPSFSDEIGADGYSKDAADCVKLVEKLLA
ncbi:5-methyltetrahydrofolate--homocysteine methyltransferase [Megasphaera cerevisiae DSM 20462]|uniref:Methionine synthase n=1 Tax=Megasphaera cerevisiae DSM 20462 TaxID=1122219 RepID=A0A0J6WWC5_9FIRM|nr:homocysteine S-methyltransferase family protein [Megasphaera cerevisiae]KMO87835.1 5-methyltetrahydrofolate--homocysteine methyltransferase [Megasphaera cerevisiae DSM 20462]SJZ50629.1 5-methyltetrahydrofolate--homocysteine methyltransferase [Megasphaera cerevisiae DSM 20462]